MCDDIQSSKATFILRCLPEDKKFVVSREKLNEGSLVFRNMFDIPHSEEDDRAPDNIVDIYDSANDISLLVRFLHEPPAAHSTKTKASATAPIVPIIPFPILSRLLDLGDKYVLSDQLVNILHSHLAAHVATEPLFVYGRATQYGLPEIADEASTHLMATRFHTLTAEQLRIIPTAEAYHKLILLQKYRQARIREHLMNSELFPFGYGVCPIHAKTAAGKWRDERGKLHELVEADTDIAAEMSSRLEDFSLKCTTCRKAVRAATDMLAVSLYILYEGESDDE